MRTRTYKLAVIGLATAFCLGHAPGLWAKVTFRARMYSSVAGDAPTNVKIEIETSSPPEDVLKLGQLGGDEAGFYTFFRSMNRGSIQFIGSLGLNIKINAIQEVPSEKGVTLRLLTESRGVEPGSTKMKNMTWRFLLVVLELDKDFKGEGKIYEDAIVNFSQRGDIEFVSSYSVPKSLVSVRLVK